MISTLAFEQILDRNDIVGYLAMRGHHPIEDEGDKWKYSCPVHDDSTPSFYVYKGEEGRQNFYCFGCKATGTILHLKMRMEGISMSQALKDLAHGLDFQMGSEIDYLINKMADGYQVKKRGEHVAEMERQGLAISCLVREFLKLCNFAEPCLEKADKVFRILDEAFKRQDAGRVAELYGCIDDFLDAEIEKISSAKEEDEEYIMKMFGKSR